MTPGYHDRLLDDYMESSYKHGNILSPEQFDKASLEYKREYEGIIPSDKQSVILDFGCGAGDFLYHLKKEGYTNFFGIDASRQQVAYCRQHVTERVDTVDGLQFLKDKPSTYDLIVAHDVLEHIGKNQTLEFLDLILCALKNNGVFLARVPNMSNPFGLDARYNDVTHEIGFTSKSLYQVFSVAGFKDIRFLPPRDIPVRSFRNGIRKILVKMLHQCIRFCYYIQDYTVPQNLDKNITVVARKAV
jgi:cyclopropane fatty-acyl-phospholipid synthase-like methyltransferase